MRDLSHFDTLRELRERSSGRVKKSLVGDEARMKARDRGSRTLTLERPCLYPARRLLVGTKTESATRGGNQNQPPLAEKARSMAQGSRS